MATRRVSSEMRRLSRSYHSLRPLQSCVFSNPRSPTAPVRPDLPTSLNVDPTNRWSTLLPFATSFRCFSSDLSESEFPDSSYSLSSGTESELESILTDVSVISDPNLAEVLGDGGYILPVRALISVLDWIHNSTGLPWWMTIVASTLMLRVSLFPLYVFQQRKLKRIVPRPFPPLFSGKSYASHFSNFRRERKAIDCPSFLWVLAYLSVQVPCFLLWMGSIRRMSLDHYTGFDTGGILWFHNLTEYAHGAPGLIFPTLIAGLHLLNVQLSLKSSKVGKETGTYALLAKYYRYYLQGLTVPIFVTGFFVPHGSLVYWVSNSSVNVIQHLCLQNSTIREKLGLSRERLFSAKDSEKPSGLRPPEELNSPRKIPVQDLSPKELVSLSVLSLSRGNKDGALPYLRLALNKDPDYVLALTTLGNTLMQKGQQGEALIYFERAIAKLTQTGLPTEAKDVVQLIQASQWAGAAYFRQGKKTEGMIHLERLASVKEPEDTKSKVHYYDGLVFLASALLNVGRKAEAIAYLEKAAAYNPDFNDYLEQSKKG